MKKRILPIILTALMVIQCVVMISFNASAATGDTYVLVTDASQLVAGGEYLIVCPSKNTVMGAQSGTFRASVSVEITDDKIVAPEGAQSVTLGGAAGAWTLGVSATEYLYWNSGNSIETGTEAYTWTIAVDAEGIATIASVATPERMIKYNSSAPRFACYTSAQTAVALFKKCDHLNTVAIGEAKNATCTENGITAGEKCTDCGAVVKEQETIDALSHIDADSNGYCDRVECGESLCTEHKWIDGDVIEPASCTKTGLQAQLCENCGQPGEDKELEKLPHSSETDAAVDATCLSTGLTEGSHCSVCQEVLTAQEIVDMIDHNYVDGVCSVCGDMYYTGTTIAEFQFGENGNAAHDDGEKIGEEKSYNFGDYTLGITSATNVYDAAFDATGKSALKLGTSKNPGSFSFTVPNNVDKVVIAVAKYKANTTKIEVNGNAYTIIPSSNDGIYANIVVDTTTNKIVNFSTVSGGIRAMIDSIAFVEDAAAAEGDTLTGYTVTLGDTIGVNFYMQLTDVTLADDTAYMLFTLPNGATVKVFVKDIKNASNDGNYKFMCDIAVKEIVDDIKAKLVTAAGESEEYTYSVKKYADYIIGDAKYTANEKALAKALLNYGAYAQLMFNYKTDDLANAALGTADKELGEVSVPDTYQKSVTPNITGVTYLGTSTVWESETAIRHYFDITGEGVTFKLCTDEGMFIKDLEAVDSVNGKYVAIDEIVAADMETTYKLVVSNGTEEQTITYSVYSYFYDILASTKYSANEKNAVKAAYNYSVAAIEYLSSK